MLAGQIGQSFESIESVQDFVGVLALTILEAMKELDKAHETAVQENKERRVRAIELALFKLKMLSCYVHKSRRALNDLRTLRRLILDERMTVERAAAA